MSNHLNHPGNGTWSILTSPNTNPYLAPEVWGHIFRFLSSSDLVSVADACPEWNELLVSEKKHALLELVGGNLDLHKIHIAYSNYYVTILTFYEPCFGIVNQILPLLNVSKRDILTCRTVSRGAKKVVDNLIQVFVEEEESFQFTHEKSFRRRSFISEMRQLNNSYIYVTSFLTGHPQRGKTAQQFLARVGGSLGRDNNPFLTRSIMIPLNVEGDEYTAMELMLTHFGHHVWSLTACVNRDDDNGGDYIRNHRLIPTKKFARLLSLVPNLKSLTLSSGGPGPIEALNPDELPELKHLVSLNFKRWINPRIEPVPLVFLRRYGRQLIELWDACNNSLLQLDELTVEVLNELLPNLKKLRLRSTVGSGLPKLIRVNWCLEELTFPYLYGWTTKHVFDVIMNFSQTLVQLQLNDDLHVLQRVFVVCDGIYGPPCKTLPNLQVLRLDVSFADVKKQDWLWNWAPMMCGSIKEIHFDREYITEHDHELRTIEFHSAKHIFLKLPNLERILYWQVTLTGRKLDILVRSDYVWDFGESLLQRMGAASSSYIF